MLKTTFLLLIISFFCCSYTWSQEESKKNNIVTPDVILKKELKSKKINRSSPKQTEISPIIKKDIEKSETYPIKLSVKNGKLNQELTKEEEIKQL